MIGPSGKMVMGNDESSGLPLVGGMYGATIVAVALAALILDFVSQEEWSRRRVVR